MTKNIFFEREYRTEELTAAELIERELDGSSYDRGSLETAQADAENCKAGLARLVQVLFDKSVLTRVDVWKVADLAYMVDDKCWKCGHAPCERGHGAVCENCGQEQ